ncbi:hypothetical protein [uncultured Draconibacterium sp.]|uniref:hypothetical protein n=1 Tax=uncultured Draconibacterium sp. TaxID=1573823 RepID=UPI003216D3C7
MISTRYDSENNIVYLSHDGEITINDATKTLRMLKNTYNHLDYVYLLEDSRNSSFSFSISEIPILIKAVKENLYGIIEVRHADIVLSPLNTALSFIYGQMVNPIKNYKYRAFSTEEAAIAWLKKGIYFQK